MIDNDDLPVIGEYLLYEFNVGDLVQYCADDMVRIKKGIILDLYNIALSERKFPHAEIYVMGEDKTETVLLGNLTIISKVSN